MVKVDTIIICRSKPSDHKGACYVLGAILQDPLNPLKCGDVGYESVVNVSSLDIVSLVN